LSLFAANATILLRPHSGSAKEAIMLIKIYVVLWMLLGLAVGVVAFTGNFTNLTATIFGFVSMPLIFAGMIIVLPGTLMHAPENEEHSAKPMLKTEITKLTERTKGNWIITDIAARKLSH
jgi:hypothetical protein